MTPKKRGLGWDWMEPNGTVLYRYINKKPSPTGPDGTPWDLPKLASGGGGGSRTPVRERSAQSVYRFSPGTFSPRTTPPDGRPSVSPPKLLACVPAGADACQPDGFDTLPGYQASPGSA